MQSLDQKLSGLAREANDEHAQAQAAYQKGVEHAARAGKALIKAKAQIGHGHWSAWLADNFRGSERTAQLYMRIARRLRELDDETRNAVAEMSLREASEAIAEPHRSRIHVNVETLPSTPRTINCKVTTMPLHPVPYGAAPPIRSMAYEAVRSSASDSSVAALPAANRNPDDGHAIVAHLAALIGHSRTATPEDFAAALGAHAEISAADLEQLASWLASSAEVLRHSAACDSRDDDVRQNSERRR